MNTNYVEAGWFHGTFQIFNGEIWQSVIKFQSSALLSHIIIILPPCLLRKNKKHFLWLEIKLFGFKSYKIIVFGVDQSKDVPNSQSRFASLISFLPVVTIFQEYWSGVIRWVWRSPQTLPLMASYFCFPHPFCHIITQLQFIRSIPRSLFISKA